MTINKIPIHGIQYENFDGIHLFAYETGYDRENRVLNVRILFLSVFKALKAITKRSFCVAISLIVIVAVKVSSLTVVFIYKITQYTSFPQIIVMQKHSVK